MRVAILLPDAVLAVTLGEERLRRRTLIHLSPWRWLSDAIELRRLRRRLPRVHRAWSRASGEQRPETNAEYLVRLRALARAREQLRGQKGNTTRVPVQGERGPARSAISC
jgi:hypothetical protein